MVIVDGAVEVAEVETTELGTEDAMALVVTDVAELEEGIVLLLGGKLDEATRMVVLVAIAPVESLVRLDVVLTAARVIALAPVDVLDEDREVDDFTVLMLPVADLG